MICLLTERATREDNTLVSECLCVGAYRAVSGKCKCSLSLIHAFQFNITLHTCRFSESKCVCVANWQYIIKQTTNRGNMVKVYRQWWWRQLPPISERVRAETSQM